MVKVSQIRNLQLQTLFLFYNDLLAASYDFGQWLDYTSVLALLSDFLQVDFLLQVLLHHLERVASIWEGHSRTLLENVSFWPMYDRWSYTTILQDVTTVTIYSTCQ